MYVSTYEPISILIKKSGQILTHHYVGHLKAKMFIMIMTNDGTTAMVISNSCFGSSSILGYLGCIVLLRISTCLENVAQFKCFGTTVKNQNMIQEPFKRRLASGNAATNQAITFCLLLCCLKTYTSEYIKP
jgi:hypothetical protein